MKQSRVYVWPTSFGWIYLAGAVFVVLIGSAYHNNLANILAFFMLSLGFVCMIRTYANLIGVKLEAVETEGGFAGSEFLVTAVVANRTKEIRFSIEMRIRGFNPKVVYDNRQHIPMRGRLRIKASFPTIRRGRHRLRRVRISSVYPLGLFEAWTWSESGVDYFVYPKPEGRESPRLGPDGKVGDVQSESSGEDFRGHRKFQDGDSFRQVDWKARARGRPLLTKEFNDGTSGSAFLDWNMVESLDDEAKLSQLSKWVNELRLRGVPFGLRIPGVAIPPGQGLTHATRCWEALSTFGERDSERSA